MELKSKTLPIIIIAVIIVIILMVLLFSKSSDPTTQQPTIQSSTPQEVNLGEQIYEQANNPVKEKLPESNPFEGQANPFEVETNPFQKVKTNPFAP